MTNETKNMFSTVPNLDFVKEGPAFFSSEYPFGEKEVIKDFLVKGIVEISCENPSCKFAFRAQEEAADRFFKIVEKKGCPICGKRRFAFFRVTSL